jgi:hypothetical protein
MILGQSYPGPALVVGPVLITAPYVIARALTNRAIRAGVDVIRPDLGVVVLDNHGPGVDPEPLEEADQCREAS